MEETIPAALASAAREFGDLPALAEPGGPRFSHGQLHERATAIASVLYADGVVPGDRVAIWSPNTHHWVLGALGALCAGATLVPVNTRFTGHEALDVISRSGASVLFVAGPFLGTDRLAALCAAAEDSPGDLGRLRSIVRIPVEAGRSADSADGRGPRDGVTGASRPSAGSGPWGPGAPPGEGGVLPRASGHGPRDGVKGASGPWEGPGPWGPGARPREAGALPRAHTVTGWAEFEDRAAALPAEVASAAGERAAAIRPEDVSDILFTSGTTGRSKGVMSAHRQSLAVARAWAECGALTSADRYLVANPFFHSFGYKAGILACLVSGATLVPQLVYDPEAAMALAAAERITVFPGPPTIYQTILDHPERASYDLSSLRLAVTGAATVPVALVERMRAELSFETVLTAYGLTEAVVATMCRPSDDPRTVATTSGRATAGFEVRIAAPGGGEAKPGYPGEILLRGPNLMLGYLDDPAATAEAIDDGRWLHTGDIGRLDADGYLTITDRLKDMYICGGFNVYPAEVEQVLARLDGVAESAVVGVADARLGEVGRAYVVTRRGHALDEAAVLAFCRERLANYKVPRQVVFRDSLPRNPSGKTLKRLLREEAS